MWKTIRTVGELHILNRVSYVTLVIVPILAGTWPAVHVAINRYNEAVTESRNALESAAERIEFAASGVHDAHGNSSRVTEILDSLNHRIDTMIESYTPKTIKNTRLPSVWAFAFLASLAVTIGHLIYQMFAPALIRSAAIREHVSNEVRRFVESPSDGQLKRASSFSSRSRYWTNEKEKDSDDISPVTRDDIIEANRRKEITVIENGAASEYWTSSETLFLAASCSGGFYLTGLLLIVWILFTQTWAVVFAAWG